MKLFIGYILITFSIYFNLYSQWIKSKFDIPAVDLYSIYFVNAETGWAVGDQGVILHTSNGGVKWFQQYNSNDISKQLRTVYFVDSLNGWAAGENLFLKTTNGGTNWESINSQSSNSFNCLYFLNKNVGWAGKGGGIKKTTDSGISWIYQFENPNALVKYFHFINDSVGWAIFSYRNYYNDSTEIIKTIDGGKHWDRIGYIFDRDLKGASFIDNTFFAFDGSFLYKSEDYGQKWEEISLIVGAGDDPLIFFCSKNIGYVILYNIIKKTTDGGYTWKKLNLPEVFRFRALYFNSEDEGWIAGNIALIGKIGDGGNQFQVQSGKMLSNTRLYSVDFPNIKTGYAVGEDWHYGTGGIVKTIDSGKTWSNVELTPPEPLKGVDFISENMGWAVGDYGYIYKTIDGGNSWIVQQSGTKAELKSVSMSDSLKGIILAKTYSDPPTGFVLRTSDGGNTWITVLKDSSHIFYSSKIIKNNGWVSGSNGILNKSTDGGISWGVKKFTNENEYLYSIFMLDSLRVFTVGNSFFKTFNGGETWYTVPIITQEYFTPLAICFVDENKGWAAGLGKYNIYKTSDGGKNWIPNYGSRSLPMYSIYCIDSLHGWAVGEETGIVRTENGGEGPFVEVNKKENKIPIEFNLSQNFPNPFNPTTTISYQLPVNSNVNLKIYDILGREAATLVNEEKPAGSYEVVFNGSGLSSGIYFYQLKALPTGRQAGEIIQTKKFVLMK
jgi:photosystem II stability/assembly factor-like uncharacterized protein